MKLSHLLLGTACLVAGAQAQAEFIKSDWKTDGDKLAVLHHETGIEWLNLSQTRGMSLQHVIDETASGGAFEGWRLPNENEIKTLYRAIYPDYDLNDTIKRQSQTSYASGAAIYWDRYLDSADVIGTVHWENDNGTYRAYAQGWTLNDAGETTVSGTFHGNYAGSPRNYVFNIYTNYTNGTYSIDTANSKVSAFLVSDGGVTRSSQFNPSMNANNANAPVNQVPVVFSGAALLGLMALRRRRG